MSKQISSLWWNRVSYLFVFITIVSLATVVQVVFCIATDLSYVCNQAGLFLVLASKGEVEEH